MSVCTCHTSVLYRISLCVYVVGGEGGIVRFMKHTSCILHATQFAWKPSLQNYGMLESAHPNLAVNSSHPLEHEA